MYFRYQNTAKATSYIIITLFILNFLVEIFEPKTRHLKENSSVYYSATSMANATRIEENTIITFGFDAEYCINNIFIEYHSGKERFNRQQATNFFIIPFYLRTFGTYKYQTLYDVN